VSIIAQTHNNTWTSLVCLKRAVPAFFDRRPPYLLNYYRFNVMFLRPARTARVAAAYLVFTVVLVMVPKADIPETLFDEANTPTNEIVVQKAASSWEYRQSGTAFVQRIFAQPRRTSVRRILSVYAVRFTDSRTFRELFCSFLC